MNPEARAGRAAGGFQQLVVVEALRRLRDRRERQLGKIHAPATLLSVSTLGLGLDSRL